jgi:hypothetical protein
VGLPPGDPFGEQNAPHLTALDLDALLMRCLGQGVQGPMGRFLLVGLVLRSQAAIRLQDEPTGWQEGHQGYNSAAFPFGDAPFAPGAGPIAQPIKPLCIKSRQSLTDGLLVAGKLCRNGAGAQALPTQHNHPGAANPIGGGMPTPSQLAHLAFLGSILRWTSE